MLYPSIGSNYSKICGSIKGYRFGSMNGFHDRHSFTTIDSNYVDGISLTHGTTYRQHIWTFAANYHSCRCGHVPAFIANDYFCDFSSPLWDGNSCSHTINSPPWFYKQLSQPTTNDIEMRVCRDQLRGNEDVRVETIEIYIQ